MQEGLTYIFSIFLKSQKFYLFCGNPKNNSPVLVTIAILVYRERLTNVSDADGQDGNEFQLENFRLNLS